MHGGNQRSKGFTIVELLIVIVVIAILAAITLVAYNGVQRRATNTARMSEFAGWRKQFELYKAQFGSYPVIPDGYYCLGTGFVGGVCQNDAGPDSHAESGNTALMTELRKVGSLPSGPRARINGFGAPYVEYGSTELYFTGAVDSDVNGCLRGTNAITLYAPLIVCEFTLVK